ncbi:MAG: SDR family oxidoreductase [Chloroflexi bacterium]|nr:SDR family oxidoreductase [Chloroflexota bacterium]
MAGSLDGETALVTGGGRGIGRAIAEAFAAAGARVALMARSQDQIDEAAAGINTSGGQALAIVGDVSNPADVQRAASQAQDRFGTISVLVSNAGITGPYAPIWDSDPEEWWRTQEIHVHGAFLCTRAVYPGMVARGGGRIIVISSRAAERGNPNISAYQVAKTAQLRFVEILAAEGAEAGIRAWSVHPGNVDTAFADAAMNRPDAQKYVPAFGARLRAVRADPSLGTPVSRVADLSVFLASGHADRLSGRYFRVEEDWQEIARRADTIQRDDLYTLRLRTLTEPGGPPPPTSPPVH